MAETQQNRSKLPSTQPTLLTAEDLWKQPDDGYRYELVKGSYVECHQPDLSAGFEQLKLEDILTRALKSIN